MGQMSPAIHDAPIFLRRPPGTLIFSGAVLAAVLVLYCLAFQGLADFDLLLVVRVAMGIVAILAVCVFFEGKGLLRWHPGLVLAGAVIFRLLFLFQQPVLSDDIHRYLWDGAGLVSGKNPYSQAPAEATPETAEAAGIRAKVNHPELVTIYPPLAQIVFGAGTLLGGGAIVMKALFSAFDLATCTILLRILARLRLPPGRAILYAWNPLPIMETAGSGHVDAVAVFFLIICLAVMLKKETTANSLAAGALFSLSVMTKLFSVMYLPVILAGKRKRAAFLVAAATTSILFVLPFLPEIANGLVTLGIYLRFWEFGGFAYRTLVWMDISRQAARLILAGAFCAVAAAVSVCILRSGSRDPLSLIRACLMTTLAYLLLAPTLHPWYAITLVPFAALSAHPAGTVFSASVLLAYAVLVPYVATGKWIDRGSVAFFVAAAPVLALILPSILEWVLGTSRRPDHTGQLSHLVGKDQGQRG